MTGGGRRPADAHASGPDGSSRAGDSGVGLPGGHLAHGAPDKKPLRDRVVLVLGAGDLATRTLALHAAARGAAIVCAGPVLAPVLETAGLAAATGGTARVIEAPAPPLLGLALARAAATVLAAPTDAMIAEAAFGSPTAARAAASALGAVLASGAQVWLVPHKPDGGSKEYARRSLDAWIAARAAASTLHPSDTDEPRPRPRER